MRITGGKLRGRLLKTPKNDLSRPTRDAVREAVFSMLAAKIPDSTFLDLFAGTGAVGIEALSRGAAEVVWIEKNPSAYRLLAQNVRNLCGSAPELQTIRADAHTWLERLPPHPRFDIVYADPPYGDTDTDDGIPRIMHLLRVSSAIAPQGVFVAEQSDEAPAIQHDEWTPLTQKRYGRTRITILQPTPT